ncbi:hypothetical protein Glove_707g74 [Diversispora epigaea]|uniref:Myb-like domain-containing protein n=1 Tax=Diversispora epigaea TaxID=1348612 RepID=A0A397G5N6_9GLOM|nr:hypothetical protein Glove_707g74 [Diversispora epigaea]
MNRNEYRNWIKIALDLEEDEILIRAVDLYGEKNWQQVVHRLDNNNKFAIQSGQRKGKIIRNNFLLDENTICTR